MPYGVRVIDHDLFLVLPPQFFQTMKLYSPSHEGKKYGLESYFVMLGGTILSRHDNEKDALKQFDARLAGEFLLLTDPIDDWDQNAHMGV